MENDIPKMSPELVNELKKQGAGETPFLVFIDTSNKTKILQNPGFEKKPFDPAKGKDASKMLAVSSVAIASFKGSPRCWWVNNNGSLELICEKI